MSDNLPAKTDLKAAFDAQVASLEVEASLTDDSLDAWIQEKIGALATAGSFEELNLVMEASGLTAAKNLLGRTFEIRGFNVRESGIQFRNNPESRSQLKKFALVKAIDVSTGEEFAIDGGGDQFVMGLVRMRDLYDFPYVGTLLGLTTATGNEMHYWKFFDPKRKPNK